MSRIVAIVVVAVLAIAVPSSLTSASAQNGQTLHVSTSARPGSGDGSRNSPFATIGAAVAAAEAGDTIEVAAGTYREGEIHVDDGVTIRAAAGATPVLSGAVVPTSWSSSGNGTWATPHDMVRFCTVCTTNPDPAVEGMAAFPEQVFVDGTPLTQVATRAEVTATTFYVDDPDPITLKNPKNNRAGYNAKPHRGASYVIGVDPGEHVVEVVQHSRAVSLAADGIVLSGFTVEKYSPVQTWDYNDPEIGTATGGAMVVASGNGLEVSGNTFRYAAAGAAMTVSDASSARVVDNRIVSNGGVGVGMNRSFDVEVENNVWSDNNTAGFITANCGGYCTLADMKVTHSENIRYAYNTVDYSGAGVDHSELESFVSDRLIGIWFDEGVVHSEIVASNFVNVPVAVFDEVSADNTIASNIVEGAGVGIKVSGSERTRIWNNTVTHALTSIMIQEDGRSDACNARASDGTCRKVETWSADRGLSWDATGLSVYNNIMSSEQTLESGDLWRYSAMLQVTGGENADGSGGTYANQMVTAVDYNVYYRQPTSDPSTTVLWQYGSNRATNSVNAPTLADFSKNPNVKVSGEEAHGIDLSGTRADNPILVNESADPTAWGSSDLHAADGGPADGTGKPLPSDVAEALGLTAGAAVDRGALVNVAW